MTDTSTQTLSSWLLDQIAADEAVAWAAADARWSYGGDQGPYHGEDAYSEMWGLAAGEGASDEAVTHAAAHDPARVLATCAAHRRIVELHAAVEDRRTSYYGKDDETPHGTPACAECGVWSEYAVRYPCPTLRALASIYADRPGFDPRWSE